MARLFCFNPDSEMAIANGGRFYTPPANIIRMAKDLGYLPAYFSDKGDAVLVQQKPDEEFIRERETIFGLSPELVQQKMYAGLGDRTAEPWGWSPRTDQFLQAGYWKEEYKGLYSRLTACQCLRELCNRLPFIRKDIVPEVCRSLDEIAVCVQGGEYVVKAPWSSSGKGQLGIGREGITVKAGEWLKGILHRQNYVIVEKRLERVCDFAMEFYADGEGTINYAGLSFFYTGNGGEYQGNYIGTQSRIEAKLTAYIGWEQLCSIKKELSEILPSALSRYKGFLGVDMMIYKDEQGEYLVQPCVEINLRYTMGVLALFISERYVAENSEGIFKISFYPGEGEAFQKNLGYRHISPLKYEENKIIAGYINLNPVDNSTKFLAELFIRKRNGSELGFVQIHVDGFGSYS